MQYYELPHGNVKASQIFKVGDTYKLSYVQPVINYLTEGFEPTDNDYKKDVGALGDVLLQASAL